MGHSVPLTVISSQDQPGEHRPPVGAQTRVMGLIGVVQGGWGTAGQDQSRSTQSSTTSHTQIRQSDTHAAVRVCASTHTPCRKLNLAFGPPDTVEEVAVVVGVGKEFVLEVVVQHLVAVLVVVEHAQDGAVAVVGSQRGQADVLQGDRLVAVGGLQVLDVRLEVKHLGMG